jgi:hypothetical protein
MRLPKLPRMSGRTAHKSLVVVMTCPRPVSYVEETLIALDRSGADLCASKMVLADGMTTTVPKTKTSVWTRPWMWVAFPGPSGTREALWRIFWMASQLEPGPTRVASSGSGRRSGDGLSSGLGFDRLYVFEDDITVSQNLFLYLEAMTIPDDVALVTLYDVKECDRESPKGLHLRPVMGSDRRGMFGTLGIMLPGRTVAYLAKQDPWSVPYWTHIPRGSADCVMSYLLEDSPWPAMAVHVPSLVDHRGEVSAEGGPGSSLARKATVFGSPPAGAGWRPFSAFRSPGDNNR